MRYKYITTLGVAGTLFLASIATPVIASTEGPSPVNVEQMVPALAERQAKKDLLPSNLDSERLGGVRLDTVRSLGSDATARYWVARAGSADICLLVHIPGGADVSASTCGPITEFYRSGLSLAAGENPDSPERSVQAYLLPDDIEISKLASLSLNARSSSTTVDTEANMLTMRWHDGAQLAPVDVPRSNGQDFRLAPLQRTGS